jgi:SOS-response transcriptional repressor LexA
MLHPTTSTIELYALSRLDGESEREFEEHLLICPSCRESLSAEDEIVRMIRLGIETGVTALSDHRSQGAKILHFRTRLPVFSLEAAAGKFGRKQEVKSEGWVDIQPTQFILTKDMFVTHVEGRSMEPKILDGSLCVFRSNLATPFSGKVLLLELCETTGGNRYTVSQYRTSNNIDPCKEGDREWLHERFTLEPLNPEFPPWDVASNEKVSVIGEFIFVVESTTSGEVGLVG